MSRTTCLENLERNFLALNSPVPFSSSMKQHASKKLDGLTLEFSSLYFILIGHSECQWAIMPRIVCRRTQAVASAISVRLTDFRLLSGLLGPRQSPSPVRSRQARRRKGIKYSHQQKMGLGPGIKDRMGSWHHIMTGVLDQMSRSPLYSTHRS